MMLKFSVSVQIIALIVANLLVLVCIASCGEQVQKSSERTGLASVKVSFSSATEVILMDKTQDERTAGHPEFLEISKVIGDSEVIGYMVDTEVTARSGPFRIRTILDLKFNVIKASVLKYLWVRGGDVRKKKFTDQFTGKGPKDAFRVGGDIDSITGATISSKAMSKGVRSSIFLTRGLVKTLGQ
jgi:Na+-translocating ferredoxin:NAD+ oxidoreductase RnfG subunit